MINIIISCFFIVVCLVFVLNRIYKNRMYEQLENMEDQIYDSTSTPVCTINKEGEIIRSNAAFKKNIVEIAEHKANPKLTDLIRIENQEKLIAADKIDRLWKMMYLNLDLISGKAGAVSGGAKAGVVIVFTSESKAETDWINNVSMPVILMNDDFEFTNINQMGLNYLDKDWKMKKVSEFITSEKFSEMKELLSKEDESKSFNTIWKLEENNLLNLKVDIKKLSEQNLEASYALFLHDVNELEEMKTKAQDAQHLQLLGQLTAGVIHDFNNILSAISSLCYLVNEELPNDHKSQKDVREIQNTTARAQELTQQLLDFTKNNTEEQYTNPSLVLKDFMQSIVMLTGDDVELNIQNNSPQHLVQLNSSQVVQILLNMIVNAKDANAKEIEIQTYLQSITQAKKISTGYIYSNQYSIIKIIDNGDGIPADIQESIFDSFYSTKETGTGLGLSTVYRLTTMAGGGIDLVSSEGRTEFTIYLPSVHVSSKDDEKSADKEVQDGLINILLVEDDATIRDLTKRALKHNNFEVIEAEDGEQALNIIRSGDQKIDLMITDVMMPKLNGIQLVSKLLDIDKALPTILMSGYNSGKLKEYVPDYVKIVSKPIKVSSLISVIRDMCS